MAYVLDSNKAVVMQISNDAFFFLKEDEEPLDEDNLDEANEILQMFPNGFVISDNWEYVEDEPDTVQVTFIPYVEEQQNWDGYIEMFGGWIIQFNILNNESAHIRHYNETTGKIFSEQDCLIKYYNNKPWLYYPADASQKSSHSEVPLWNKGVVAINKDAFNTIGIKFK